MSKATIRRGKDPAASRADSADRIWVCLSKTINIGNYESVRIEYGEGRASTPGEEQNESRQALIREVVTVLAGLESEVRDLLAKV